MSFWWGFNADWFCACWNVTVVWLSVGLFGVGVFVWFGFVVWCCIELEFGWLLMVWFGRSLWDLWFLVFGFCVCRFGFEL